MSKPLHEADVVVVGAGSAGCVVAARLSEDPALNVLLIEAGQPSRYPWIDVPIGYFKTVGHPQFDWCFETEQEPAMGGRTLAWPRGKGLGGSSLINGMLYLRGHRRDYDRWQDLGNAGWGWDEVLPYFQRSMHGQRLRPGSDGVGGPLWVCDLPRDVLSDAFVDACVRSGIGATDDFNGGDNTGAGYFRMTVRNGRRMSTGRAYLAPALSRPNLQVLSGAQALGLELQGLRATGVRVLVQGRQHLVRARHEVVLSAGAVQSPHLLMLSGIGPAQELLSHGIAVALDLPGVGQNLQDHLQVRPSYRCQGVETLNDVANSRWRSARDLLRYAATRTGSLATGVYRAGAFLSLDDPAHADWPNVQIHFGLVSFERPHQPPHPFPGMTLSACMLRPQSRGRIALRDADPLSRPRIHANYLMHESDQRLAVAAVRKMREIATTEPLARYVLKANEPRESLQSDTDILAWVRQRSASIFHPVGTCKMGPDSDDGAVLDARLRVRGMQGLRVVDGSAMPLIVSGNTNAPIIMMAEKAADMVRTDLQSAKNPL